MKAWQACLIARESLEDIVQGAQNVIKEKERGMYARHLACDFATIVSFKAAASLNFNGEPPELMEEDEEPTRPQQDSFQRCKIRVRSARGRSTSSHVGASPNSGNGASFALDDPQSVRTSMLIYGSSATVEAQTASKSICAPTDSPDKSVLEYSAHFQLQRLGQTEESDLQSREDYARVYYHGNKYHTAAVGGAGSGGGTAAASSAKRRTLQPPQIRSLRSYSADKHQQHLALQVPKYKSSASIARESAPVSGKKSTESVLPSPPPKGVKDFHLPAIKLKSSHATLSSLKSSPARAYQQEREWNNEQLRKEYIQMRLNLINEIERELASGIFSKGAEGDSSSRLGSNGESPVTSLSHSLLDAKQHLEFLRSQHEKLATARAAYPQVGVGGVK